MPDLRRATDSIRWKPARECQALNADPDSPHSCCCRIYDGAPGWYVIRDGHAHAYHMEKPSCSPASASTTHPVPSSSGTEMSPSNPCPTVESPVCAGNVGTGSLRNL